MSTLTPLLFALVLMNVRYTDLGGILIKLIEQSERGE